MADKSAPIEARAAFDRIRYAQLWEDADVLALAFGDLTGRPAVSIASAGDNALAMLTLNPSAVYTADLSPAQLQCLALRIGAYRELEHGEFLELMGSRDSTRRPALLRQALADASDETQAFWSALSAEVTQHGAGGVGKFEAYFRMFQRYVLPLTHSKQTLRDLFEPRSTEANQRFYETRFDTWRWRLLMRVFFSRFMMGRFGRDPAFFDHVEGSVADHVMARCAHAARNTPDQNPYLRWIITGTHGQALPLSWRAEHYETIRARLDRIVPHLGPIDALDVSGIAAFNLSDIFEYMAPSVQASVYAGLLAQAAPGARLAYWNMMAPRRVPPDLAGRVSTRSDLEDAGRRIDKAFFYRDFVVEEVR